MKEARKQKHVIDSLFPIVLFFLFTICAVIVLFLATQIYESITNHSYRNNTARTAITYVTEKIHQNDDGSSIAVDALGDIPALKLVHSGQKSGYTTYIYFHEGSLKELFIRNEIIPDASAGSFIANVTAFNISPVSSDLFELICTDEQGNRFQTLVGIRSYTER